MSTNQSIQIDPLVQNYMSTLSEKELKAYHIAKDHLGDSFQIEKSNGFLTWVKKNGQLDSNNSK